MIMTITKEKFQEFCLNSSTYKFISFCVQEYNVWLAYYKAKEIFNGEISLNEIRKNSAMPIDFSQLYIETGENEYTIYKNPTDVRIRRITIDSNEKQISKKSNKGPFYQTDNILNLLEIEEYVKTLINNINAPE